MLEHSRGVANLSEQADMSELTSGVASSFLVVARCAVEECTNPVVGWGYCAPHFANWRHTGDPIAEPEPWLPRFMMKVGRRSDDDCWPWLGAINKISGYGYFNQNGRTRLAHQVAYEVGNGSLPEGLEPDHTCRNRPCVNWHHLEAITHRENVLRSNGASAQYARREKCPNDHPYTPETTLWTDGGRRCAICASGKKQRRNQTKREARRSRL